MRHTLRLANPWIGLFDRLQKRFLRSRPGSVLIMVVSILVLLSLVGTVLIATTRTDRIGSQQNVHNTQIELLLDGIRTVTIFSLVDDLFGKDASATTPLYRPRSDSVTSFTYTPVDSFATDPLIASRAPEGPDNAPIWPKISAPLLGVNEFRSPSGNATATSLTNVRPTSLTIAGKTYPALDFGGGNVLLAADADGDGVADAGLWMLPVGQVNGVTYFTAARAIDGNSAAHAGIAWKPNSESPAPVDFFPTNIDLQSLLAGGAAEVSQLNRYRFNDPAGNVNLTPLTDQNIARTDFVFATPYDAFYMQYGRRPRGPGLNFGVPYRGFGVPDQLAMSWRFLLRNPSASPTTIEAALATSLWSTARTLPYRADQFLQWKSENFSDNTAGAFSRRAHLTAVNGVSNLISKPAAAAKADYTPPPGMRDYASNTPRTSINTADFSELWRAFRDVMCDVIDLPATGAASDPNNYVTAAHPNHPQKMFRPSIRDIRYTEASPPDAMALRFEPEDMLLMRAAQAAINTKALRDSRRQVQSQRITLTASGDFGAISSGGDLGPWPMPGSGFDRSKMRDFAGPGSAVPNMRPWVPEQNGSIARIENIYAHDLGDDAIHASGQSTDRPIGGKPLTFGAIEIRNCEIARIVIPPGSGKHSDAIQLIGMGVKSWQGTPIPPPCLLIEDVYIHDMGSGSMTCLVSGLANETPYSWDTIILRRVRTERTFADIKLGYARQIIIEDSPGVMVGIYGPKGSTGAVYVKNSPGANVRNVLRLGMYPDAPIIVTNNLPGPTTLPSTPPTAGQGTSPVEVTVFGYEPQPFITEVFAHTDNYNDTTGQSDMTRINPKGYVAVELYNPYTFPISLANWRLALMDRRPPAVASDPYYRRKIVSISDFAGIPAGTVIAPGKRVVLENYTDTAGTGDENAAHARPPKAAGLAQAITDGEAAVVYVRNLHEVMTDPVTGKTGGELVLLRPRNADGTLSLRDGEFDENNLYDLVPVDQFDFTGLSLPQAPPTGDAPFSILHYVRGNNGRFVYPGRYNGMKASARQEGTDVLSYGMTAAEPEFTGRPAVALGLVDSDCSYAHPFAPITLPESAGPNPVTGSGLAYYPFGGFARNGDLLQVPYISAYRVRELNNDGTLKNAPDVLLELNAITMDAAFADDTDPSNDGVEAVGRFCPTYLPNDHYAWATDLFDVLTTFNPHDDYLPNLDRTAYPVASEPTAVANTDDRSANVAEETVPIEGLVNINTAPWRVLAALPLSLDSQGRPDRVASAALAKAIVADRAARGPFRTLFDLNRVADQSGRSFMNGWTGQPVSPDYVSRFQTLTRISSMVTTRSDQFTCYVILQGWRGAGTDQPELVVQRRAAFIVDRSPVTADNKRPTVINVPME